MAPTCALLRMHGSSMQKAENEVASSISGSSYFVQDIATPFAREGVLVDVSGFALPLTPGYAYVNWLFNSDARNFVVGPQLCCAFFAVMSASLGW